MAKKLAPRSWVVVRETALGEEKFMCKGAARWVSDERLARTFDTQKAAQTARTESDLVFMRTYGGVRPWSSIRRAS